MKPMTHPGGPKISPEVRAAISSFLNDRRCAERPLAIKEAMDAIRRIFPDLNVPDEIIIDALSFDAPSDSHDVGGSEAQTTSIEGLVTRGAGNPTLQTRRAIENDTSGTRRREQATKDRNELI